METPKRYHPVLVTLHWLIVLLVFANLFLAFFEIEPQLRGGGFRVPEAIVTIHMAVGIAILVLLVIRLFVRIGSAKPIAVTSGSKLFDGLARAVHYALYFFVFVITVVGLVFALQTNRLQRAFLGGSDRGFAGPNGGNFGGFPTAGPGTPRPSFGGFPTAGPGTPRSSFGGGNNPGFGGQPGGVPGSQGGGGRPGARGGPAAMAFLLLPLHLDIAIVLSFLIALHILAALYHQFIRKDNLIARMWYGRA